MIFCTITSIKVQYQIAKWVALSLKTKGHECKFSLGNTAGLCSLFATIGQGLWPGCGWRPKASMPHPSPLPPRLSSWLLAHDHSCCWFPTPIQWGKCRWIGALCSCSGWDSLGLVVKCSFMPPIPHAHRDPPFGSLWARLDLVARAIGC